MTSFERALIGAVYMVAIGAEGNRDYGHLSVIMGSVTNRIFMSTHTDNPILENSTTE